MSDVNERSVASAGSVADVSDIVERLRVFAVEAFALPVADLADGAADEIERLRLTDDERQAIRQVIPGYEMAAVNEGDAELGEIAATLRGLLERMK